MGHKTHPIGLRLGIHRKWKSNWFFDSKNYAKFIHLNLNIEKFFRGYLYFYGIKTLLLNCQIIKLPSNQIFIFIFHYRLRKKHKKNLYKWRLKKWKLHLEKYFLKLNLRKKSKKHYIKQLRNFQLKEYSNSLKNVSNQRLLKSYVLIENLSYSLIKKYLETFFNKMLKNIQIINNIKVLLNFKKNSFLKKYSFILKNVLKNLILRNRLLIKKFKLISVYIKTKNSLHVQNIYLNKKVIPLYYNIYAQFNLKIIQTIFIKNMYKNNYNLNFFIKYLSHIYKIKNKIKRLTYFSTKIIGTKKNFFLNKSKKLRKKKNSLVYAKRKFFNSTLNVKKFLSKITNSKINLIFINSLSFTKFFYTIWDSSKKTSKKKKLRYNVLQIQKMMINKYKYSAIFIKDFVHLAFISVLLKNTQSLVNFIGEQFKRLPKNRKQFKLLRFLQQSLKVFCKQRKEFIGFRFQIKGRLNRRSRTHKWTFNQGILPIQTHKSRLEYGYTEGLTRSGLIGIKLWFFYKKAFKFQLKNKLLQYLYYSKHKKNINKTIQQNNSNKWKQNTIKTVSNKNYNNLFTNIYEKQASKYDLKQKNLIQTIAKTRSLKRNIFKNKPLNRTRLKNQSLKLYLLKRQLKNNSFLKLKNKVSLENVNKNNGDYTQSLFKIFPQIEPLKFYDKSLLLQRKQKKSPKFKSLSLSKKDNSAIIAGNYLKNSIKNKNNLKPITNNIVNQNGSRSDLTLQSSKITDNKKDLNKLLGNPLNPEKVSPLNTKPQNNLRSTKNYSSSKKNSNWNIKTASKMIPIPKHFKEEDILILDAIPSALSGAHIDPASIPKKPKGYQGTKPQIALDIEKKQQPNPFKKHFLNNKNSKSTIISEKPLSNKKS